MATFDHREMPYGDLCLLCQRFPHLESRQRHLQAEGRRAEAIDEAYGPSGRPDTLGDFAATWTERHPRSKRTNATNDHRISRVADVEIKGIPLKDWPLRELRRRHTSPWSTTC